MSEAEIAALSLLTTKLGALGVLAWLLQWSLNSRFKAGKEVGKRIDDLNDKRVAEAERSVHTMTEALKVAAQLMENSVKHAELSRRTQQDLASLVDDLSRQARQRPSSQDSCSDQPGSGA